MTNLHSSILQYCCNIDDQSRFVKLDPNALAQAGEPGLMDHLT
jgi:hypothetical protein